MDRKCIIEG